MSPTTATKRKLSTAEERRAAVVKAAIQVFAAHGYRAASTMEIAKKAGISQAYVFRLFPTKAELFTAAYKAGSRRMFDVFHEAAADARANGYAVLDYIGHAYAELLDREREVLLMQLHGQVAASEDPLIRDAVRSCFAQLYDEVGRESGAGPEELKFWFAYGMLWNVMAAIGADKIDEPWAKALTSEGPTGK
jgi:AcrR family transcriptional regulator